MVDPRDVVWRHANGQDPVNGRIDRFSNVNAQSAARRPWCAVPADILVKLTENQLINSGLLARMTKERPNFDFVAHRCAEWFGGQARDHEALVFGMWAFMHGTAMLRISGTVQDENASRSRVIFMKSLAVLVKNAEKLRGL
jgi:hypothetical protein